jgi:sulfofructose kinase
MIDIFGLGQCSLDYIGKVDRYPPPDAKCEFVDMVVESGGPVATALAALSRWGNSCYFSGVIGDDLFGRMIESSLKAEGVDAAGLVIRPGFSSQFAFIATEPASGRRTIFWQRPTGDPLKPDEIDLEVLRQSRVYHTDGLMIDASIFAAAEARRTGVPVSVDGGTFRDGMLDLARLSDCFIASETFVRGMEEGHDPLSVLRRLSELGPRVVAATLGEKGYLAIADGKVIRKPAYHVETIDTTGCGDVFHAGFLHGFIRGWETERSLDLGAWAASRAATMMGGRAGIPSLHDLGERGDILI